jgi:membrane-associated phospholipid phosphatase
MAGWVAAFGGAALLARVLKVAVRRSRPPYASVLLHGFSYSFPSGHATDSLIGYGMLAYFLLVCWGKHSFTQAAIISGSALLVLAIGFSRLYLGVHYFSDVIGGYAAGMVWLSICITGVEIARRRR